MQLYSVRLLVWCDIINIIYFYDMRSMTIISFNWLLIIRVVHSLIYSIDERTTHNLMCAFYGIWDQSMMIIS